MDALQWKAHATCSARFGRVATASTSEAQCFPTTLHWKPLLQALAKLSHAPYAERFSIAQAKGSTAPIHALKKPRTKSNVNTCKKEGRAVRKYHLKTPHEYRHY
jgi:hypothetical protein